MTKIYLLYYVMLIKLYIYVVMHLLEYSYLFDSLTINIYIHILREADMNIHTLSEI